MQYTTRYVEIAGRQVPIQTTKAMDDRLVAGLGRKPVREHGAVLAGLRRRELMFVAWSRFTETGARLAEMIRDERLEGEPASAPKTPEYRVHPDITAHDRVVSVNDIVTVHKGTDRWRVDAVEDGAAYVRPQDAPRDAQGMWVTLTLVHPVPTAQNGSQAAGA